MLKGELFDVTGSSGDETAEDESSLRPRLIIKMRDTDTSLATDKTADLSEPEQEIAKQAETAKQVQDEDGKRCRSSPTHRWLCLPAKHVLGLMPDSYYIHGHAADLKCLDMRGQHLKANL